jgi:hypothetical protein
MDDQIIEVGGEKYTVSPIENSEESYGGPAFVFTILSCNYEVAQGEDGNYSLSRVNSGF